MKPLFHVVIENADHPKYGVATIPFPIPKQEYDHVLELLKPMELGDAVRRDCRIKEIEGDIPVLKRMEENLANLDELDYLAKRLDSFSDGEIAQFQGIAAKMGTSHIADFINLTFCCQQVTVITDFSNLEAVGRDHYMNLNGGCASKAELDDLDGLETALLLISDNEGFITPYGVVYDNGMRMEALYDGKHLPCYHYEPDMLAAAITSREQPENTKEISWICLPATKSQIERAMARSGIADSRDMRVNYSDSSFSAEIEIALDYCNETIFELNDLAQDIVNLSRADQKKLGAVVALAEPQFSFQIRNLIANLDLFEFVPGVTSSAEYGKYMIQKSGHFEYDPNLDEFYNYEQYGRQRMAEGVGLYTGEGYVSYRGAVSLEELMMEDPADQSQNEQGFRMEGM